MKKIYLLSAALFAASSMMAQSTISELMGRERVPQQTNVTEYVGAVNTPRTETRGEVPATIIGKKYVAFYDTFTNYVKCAYGFSVEQGTGDTVILKNLGQGEYDLKGVYDQATGKVTVPTGQVVGNLANYGAVTCYTMLAPAYSQYSRTEPCVLTFTADGKVAFNHGFYGTISAGAVIRMSHVSAVEANGSMKVDQYNSSGALVQQYDYPVYFNEVSDTKVSVQGMASWLYGHDYKVPFTISGSTATLATTDTVDWYKSSSSGIQAFFMLSHNSNGVSANPTFAVTRTDADHLTLKANTNLFEGYSSDGENWRGFFLRSVQLTYAKANQGGGELDTVATVDGIDYTLDNQKLEATATGCAASMTALNIPNTFTANGKTYTVVRVAKAAFQANRNIKTMKFPKSIKVVETDAFRNITNLNQLEIEDMTAWCAVWFANGNANPIYNVFPTSESKWGKVYINGQQVSTAVTVPEGVTRLGRTFYGFKSLTSVNLPSTLKVLGDQAFANCAKLTTVELPAGLDSLGSAFFSCSGLTSIDVPRSVQVIGQSAFYGCKALANVRLHTGLRQINSMAFSSCSALKEIKLPSTVDSISPAAFMMADNIVKMECLAVVPPRTGATAFTDIAETCTLYVPNSSIAAYKAATGWSAFTKVEQYTGAVSGLDNDDAPAVYYDLQGNRVASPARGIYIRVQGGKATKVLVNE